MRKIVTVLALLALFILTGCSTAPATRVSTPVQPTHSADFTTLTDKALTAPTAEPTAQPVPETAPVAPVAPVQTAPVAPVKPYIPCSAIGKVSDSAGVCHDIPAAPVTAPQPQNLPLQPCAQEDQATPCYWDAKTMGDGYGDSFIVNPDGTTTITGHTPKPTDQGSKMGGVYWDAVKEFTKGIQDLSEQEQRDAFTKTFVTATTDASGYSDLDYVKLPSHNYPGYSYVFRIDKGTQPDSDCAQSINDLQTQLDAANSGEKITGHSGTGSQCTISTK